MSIEFVLTIAGVIVNLTAWMVTQFNHLRHVKDDLKRIELRLDKVDESEKNIGERMRLIDINISRIEQHCKDVHK